MADSLAEALAAFQLELPRLGKASTANTGTYSYRYADLADVSTLVLPLLAKHGLSFLAKPTLTADGRFVLDYKLLHASGQHESGEYPLPSSGSPQQIGSAITYARRYALSAVTGIAPDEDDDGASAPTVDTRRQARHEEPEQRRDDTTVPTVTQQQHRRMQALWRELGFGGESHRDMRLHITAKILGMEELATSAALSVRQAERVIAALEQRKREQERDKRDQAQRQEVNGDATAVV